MPAVCSISFSNASYDSSASATTGCPATRAIWARHEPYLPGRSMRFEHRCSNGIDLLGRRVQRGASLRSCHSPEASITSSSPLMTISLAGEHYTAPAKSAQT